MEREQLGSWNTRLPTSIKLLRSSSIRLDEKKINCVADKSQTVTEKENHLGLVNGPTKQLDHSYTIALAALAILGQRSAHSFPMGPVIADPADKKEQTSSEAISGTSSSILPLLEPGSLNNHRGITMRKWGEGGIPRYRGQTYLSFLPSDSQSHQHYLQAHSHLMINIIKQGNMI